MSRPAKHRQGSGDPDAAYRHVRDLGVYMGHDWWSMDDDQDNDYWTMEDARSDMRRGTYGA